MQLDGSFGLNTKTKSKRIESWTKSGSAFVIFRIRFAASSFPDLNTIDDVGAVLTDVLGFDLNVVQPFKVGRRAWC